jgi:hypothetical protein
MKRRMITAFDLKAAARVSDLPKSISRGRSVLTTTLFRDLGNQARVTPSREMFSKIQEALSRLGIQFGDGPSARRSAFAQIVIDGDLANASPTAFSAMMANSIAVSMLTDARAPRSRAQGKLRSCHPKGPARDPVQVRAISAPRSHSWPRQRDRPPRGRHSAPLADRGKAAGCAPRAARRSSLPKR